MVFHRAEDTLYYQEKTNSKHRAKQRLREKSCLAELIIKVRENVAARRLLIEGVGALQQRTNS
jgi:hypothetical protein